MRRYLLILAYFGLGTVVLVAGVAVWGYAEFTRPGPLAMPRVVVVPPGSGLEKISKTLFGSYLFF